MAAVVNWLCLALAFAVFLNGITCITLDPKGANGNDTNIDVSLDEARDAILDGNVTLVTDSELSASERTRRLIPYMAFYVPVQELPINQQYAPIPTSKQAVRPSATGASGPLIALPPQYVPTKLTSPPGQAVGAGGAPYLPSPSAAAHYQPSAGDVYHTLTYGGPQHQQQHLHQQPPHFQLLPTAIKQIDNNDNQKYSGHHLLLPPGPPGPSAPSNVNLPGGKIKPIRHKTVQHFPPLPSQPAGTSTSPAYGGTFSTKQQHMLAAYRPRSKQSKINLTPFTPSNSEPGNFVPIVYTPVNSNSNSNNDNNNNIVITSQATASSHDETATPLKKDTRQQQIGSEYSAPPPQSIDGVPPHHYHYRPIAPSAPGAAHSPPDPPHQHSHQPNLKQQVQYFSVTPSPLSAISGSDTRVAAGEGSHRQHTQTASPPSIYQHLQHAGHVLIGASPRPPQQITLIGSRQQQTTQQQYRTKIAHFQPSKPENFFDTALPQSHQHVEQQRTHYDDKRTPQPPQEQQQQQQQQHTTRPSDLRNIPHNHYPASSPPQSSPSFAYSKFNGPSTPQYVDFPVDEPQQSLDEDQNVPHRQHLVPLKPTLGPPSHAYIIVTTAAPIIHQSAPHENYGSTIGPVYKNKGNVRLQPVKEKNANYPAIRQPHPTIGSVVTITPTQNSPSIESGPKYVYVKEEFGQRLSTPSIKLKPLSKYENNKATPSTKHLTHDDAPTQALASGPPTHANDNGLNQAVTQPPQPHRPSAILADPNELPDIRTSSLAEILHKLQESNHLPHTLTPDNIDNSIKTLIRILNNLKQTQTIVANPPQHHETPPPSSPDYDYTTGSEEQGPQQHQPLQHDLSLLPPVTTPNKHPGPSTGRPGVDYPNYAEIPQTSFDCSQQRYKGFFGDPETSCQVWHYCDLNGGKASFLCPNGTIFSQIALTCDWWFNVKCASTAQLYVLNERLYKYILPFTPKFPEDYSGPLVDKYLAMKFQEMEDKMRLEKEKALQEQADTENEKHIEQTSEVSREEKHLDDTTTEKTIVQSSVEPSEHKHESVNSQVSEQSSERNLLIDDEVDDISQRGSIDTFESTTIAAMTASVKPQEFSLSLRPIVVSSTREPDFEEYDQHDDFKRGDDSILTNKTETSSQHKNTKDSVKNISTPPTNAKENGMKITVEKVEVIEIKPDGATGHLIREMIMNSEKK